MIVTGKLVQYTHIPMDSNGSIDIASIPENGKVVGAVITSLINQENEYIDYVINAMPTINYDGFNNIIGYSAMPNMQFDTPIDYYEATYEGYFIIEIPVSNIIEYVVLKVLDEYGVSTVEISGIYNPETNIASFDVSDEYANKYAIIEAYSSEKRNIFMTMINIGDANDTV